MWPDLCLSVLTLRLAPSAEPAHHMTVNLLPGSGLPTGTGKIQLRTYKRTDRNYTTR